MCILFALALDRHASNADRWLKVLWTPFYLALTLYEVSKYLAFPTFSHGLEALFSLFGTIFNWVQLFASLEVPQMNEPPDEYVCGMIPFITFGFITEPIIKRLSRSKDISIHEIPPLVDHDTCRAVWEITKNPKLSFYWKIFAPIWSDFLLQSLSQFTSSILTCVKPLVLGKLVWYVTDQCATKADPDAPPLEAFSIAGVDISIEGTVLLLLVCPIIQGIAEGQLYSRGRHLGIRIRSSIVALVYQKILRVDLTATSYSVGKVNNLISVDASSIQSYMVYTNYLWSTQLEIAICIFLLYKVLGPEAFVGICVIVSSIPICYYLTEKQKSFQTVMLQEKDERMAAINEILNSIRIIKLFAWEDRFKEQVEKLRSAELNSLWGYTYSGVVMYIITDSIPTIVAMSTYMFRIYIRGQPLSAAEGYMALLLFNMIKRPLQLFPEMVGWGIQAYVAMERISEFLECPEILGIRLKIEAPEVAPPPGSPRRRSSSQIINPVAVSFRHATMSWYNVKKDEDTGEFDEDSETVCMLVKNGCSFRKKRAQELTKATKSNSFLNCFKKSSSKLSGAEDFVYSELDFSAHDDDESNGIEMKASDLSGEGLTARVQLYNINADITKGSLVGIIGPTGSGKSTILSAILGECLLNRPDSVVAFGDISYAPQSPWIRQGSVRDNITFGLPFDEERYQRVVYCCSLLSDFELLPLGDQTEIGEKGVNLSGGQKQRVSLARAAYSNSDIILMDDVLSAVDAHVGEHIFM
jgi:ABC-type multidrug transport system fused ATPase/permease subunit